MKTPCNMGQKLPVVLVAGLGGLFTVVDVACTQPWATTTAPTLPWKAIASSADGTRLVAASNARSYFGGPPAPIFVSTNSGASWAQTSAPSNNWSSVACSADGMKLIATSAPYYSWYYKNLFGDGRIYTSPDGGTTWTPASVTTNSWSSVASSADGATLVAVSSPNWVFSLKDFVGDGLIYRSSNSGASWTVTVSPTNYWTSVAASADGVKLVAVAGFSRVNYTDDQGGEYHFFGSSCT